MTIDLYSQKDQYNQLAKVRSYSIDSYRKQLIRNFITPLPVDFGSKDKWNIIDSYTRFWKQTIYDHLPSLRHKLVWIVRIHGPLDALSIIPSLYLIANN